MKITQVDSFRVEVPITETQGNARCYNATGVTRIRTDDGITGYGFSEVDGEAVRAILLG